MRLAAIRTIALALGVSSSLLFKRLKKEPGPGRTPRFWWRRPRGIPTLAAGLGGRVTPVILHLSANAAMLTAETSYKESDESCSSQEAAHSYRRGGDRPSTAHALPGSLPFGPGFSRVVAAAFPIREKGVLDVLGGGRSNKEIGGARGIEERTVKAHIAKLMRKAGFQNRLALSVHAVTHSLVSSSSNPN